MKRAGKVCGDSQDLKSLGSDCDNDDVSSVSSVETDNEERQQKEEEEEEGEGDDGGLTFDFTPLMNLDGLNATIERDLLTSYSMRDYFHDDCVIGTPLEHECLLVAMSVYY